MFFSSRTQEYHYSIFLSLTSSTVSAALVRKSASTKEKTAEEVLVTVTEALQIRKEMTLAAISTTLEQTVANVLEAILTARPESAQISAVHYILSSPWIATHAKTVSSTFDEPTKINRDAITELIGSEKELMLENDPTAQFIEEKICSVRIDDREVESFSKAVATQVEVTFVISTTSENIRYALESAVYDVLPDLVVEYHSALLLEYSTLSRLYPDTDDCVYIDIHGEVTDVVAMSGGIPRYTGSFPSGHRSFLQNIARHLGISHSLAQSKVNLFTRGMHTPEVRDDMTNALFVGGNAWRNHIHLTTKEIGLTMIPPQKILVSADEYQDAFVALLEKGCADGTLGNYSDIIEYSHDIFGSHLAFIPTSREEGRLAAYILGVRDLL